MTATLVAIGVWLAVAYMYAVCLFLVPGADPWWVPRDRR